MRPLAIREKGYLFQISKPRLRLCLGTLLSISKPISNNDKTGKVKEGQIHINSSFMPYQQARDQLSNDWGRIAAASCSHNLPDSLAEDLAEVISRDEESVTVPQNPVAYDDNVLKTKDFTPHEPGVFEYKYYAPGVGMLAEEAYEDEVATGETVELLP